LGTKPGGAAARGASSSTCERVGTDGGQRGGQSGGRARTEVGRTQGRAVRQQVPHKRPHPVRQRPRRQRLAVKPAVAEREKKCLARIDHRGTQHDGNRSRPMLLKRHL
jgi:hypothetical protein